MDSSVSVDQILSMILGGLGLFFIGVRLIGSNLRKMSGRKFRKSFAKLTNRSWLTALMGVVAGAITQSTSAVTFITTGLISAGLVTTRRVMPMVLWSNPGNCLLVFLAVINFHVAVLYFLGLVGFLYYMDFDKTKGYGPLVGGLLGVALLFFGLDTMKAGAAPLKEFAWFTEFLKLEGSAYILGLLAAGVLSFVAQSAASVSAIAIALAHTGVLGLPGALIIVYGTNIGPAISVWLLSKKLSGAARQMAIFQVIFKFTGIGLLVPLFYLEIYTDLPLVMALLESLSESLPHQLALGYLIFQVTGAVTLTFLMNPLSKWLSKAYPETEEEQLGKSKHLYDDAIKDPETALDLVSMEQVRVLERYPEYLQLLRQKAKTNSYSIATLHSGTVALNKEIESYLHELMGSGNIERDTLERALRVDSRMEQLISMEENLYEMVYPLVDRKFSKELASFVEAVCESMDVMIMTLLDLLKDNDPMDRQFLSEMTGDKEEYMEKFNAKMRKLYPDLRINEQKIIQSVTGSLERLVWTVRYFVRQVAE